MGYIGKVNIDGTSHSVGSTLYGTCSTEASTQAKVVTCASFDKLVTGVTIHVKFTNSNTHASPQLNVNGTGAKNIYKFGTTAPGTSANASWYAGSIVSFTYDGAYWIMNDHLDDSNTWVANGKTTAGYVASPNSVGNLAWVTALSDGSPKWLDRWQYENLQSTSDSLYQAIYNAGWVSDVFTS